MKRILYQTKNTMDTCEFCIEFSGKLYWLNDDLIEKQIFNVGGRGSNIRKIYIGNAIKEFLPNTDIQLVQEKNIDPRNYRVSFKKIKTVLHYSTQITLKKE